MYTFRLRCKFCVAAMFDLHCYKLDSVDILKMHVPYTYTLIYRMKPLEAYMPFSKTQLSDFDPVFVGSWYASGNFVLLLQPYNTCFSIQHSNDLRRFFFSSTRSWTETAHIANNLFFNIIRGIHASITINKYLKKNMNFPYFERAAREGNWIHICTQNCRNSKIIIHLSAFLSVMVVEILEIAMVWSKNSNEKRNHEMLDFLY